MRELTTAVVLARGRGTRMRAAGGDVVLDPLQRQAADRGQKALIPFYGHPFLSYVLTSLADAGYRDVCIVVGPGTDPIRAHYHDVSVSRLVVRFAVQEEPLGSAHALLAAEPLIDDEEFTLVNADNLYPVEALTTLRTMARPGLIGFRRAGLLRGNVTAERLHAYALITVTSAGELEHISEKPSAAEVERAGDDALFSMTCWRFSPRIFESCRRTALSARGEYEVPDAVRNALHEEHERFRVAVLDAAVLDLSHREDIVSIQPFLRAARVAL